MRRGSASDCSCARPVLNAEWDPIDAAQAVDDEYDRYYIPEIQALLESGASAERLAGYLRSIEVECMGLSSSSQDTLLTVAEKLQKLQLPGSD
jgi:hypothetical protein